jgi:hypothetical protein
MLIKIYRDETTNRIVAEDKEGNLIRDYEQKDAQPFVKLLWGRKERWLEGTFDPKTKMMNVKPID